MIEKQQYQQLQAAHGQDRPKKSMRLYLAGMFALCYFAWVAVHA